MEQNGAVDIKLSKAITIDGASVSALRMREPTVADQIAVSKITTDAVEAELAMFAQLCMVKPSDLHQLTMRDYKKVQAAYLGFTD